MNKRYFKPKTNFLSLKLLPAILFESNKVEPSSSANQESGRFCEEARAFGAEQVAAGVMLRQWIKICRKSSLR